MCAGVCGCACVFVGVSIANRPTNHCVAVPVLTQTWGLDAAGSIGYYSDVEDPTYSTSNVGVPNTEQGYPGTITQCDYK